MHLESLAGKWAQLRQANFSTWLPFAWGWVFGRRSGVVPCVVPGSRQLLRVPARAFYESYRFFCENPAGRSELEFFLDHLGNENVLYDIGAFRGAFSTMAKVRTAGRLAIHAFEPLPQNAETVCEVARLNGFTDFKVNAVAVSDGDQLTGRLSADGSMLAQSDEARTKNVQFPAVSIDSYIARGASAPSVMKIDVEGFELQVLRGGQVCLEKYRPRIWMEVHPGLLESQGSSAQKVLDFLRGKGYTISFFDDYNSPSAKLSYHIWCV